MSAFLGLGSNIGERYNNLQLSIKYLNDHPHIWILNKSYIYESSPMYLLDQQNFYNMVIEIETNLDPLNLLRVVKEKY